MLKNIDLVKLHKAFLEISEDIIFLENYICIV